MNTLTLTASGMIAGLTQKRGLLPQTEPRFLIDALRMKKARGDGDILAFRQTVNEYGSRGNASINGAANAARQWLAKSDKLGWSQMKVDRYAAFLADLESIEAGTFGVEWKAVA